jgi:S1-C subfamily serine protease
MRNLERSELRVREVEAQRFMVARVRPRVATDVVSNTGWLGVSFSSNFRIVERPGETRLFHFQEYPVVEAVEPASPARRAGIEVGDLLLAFKHKDLRAEPIALDEMLSPGSRLPVRLKRGDATRTVTVIVGERPRGAWAVEVDPPAPAPRPPATPEVWVPSPAPTATLLPPQAPIHVYALSSSIVSLAGAEMAQLPVEMREQVGASGGLLVLRVGQGTLASRAGLRSGDVLVKVNGKAIRSSRDLRAAFESSNRTLALDLVRKRETMSVKMAW